MVNSVSEMFSQEEMLDRAFQRIAWNVKHMREETGRSDTRLFIEPIIPDKFVIIGQSKNGGTYKEHIVPRSIICEKCHELFENGKSIDDVAKFIKKYLKIILISTEERDTLDKGSELNLRQRMPEGWSFESGSEFVRLHEAKIKFKLYSEKPNQRFNTDRLRRPR